MKSTKVITKEIQEIIRSRVNTGYASALAIATISGEHEEYYEFGRLSYDTTAPLVSRDTLFEIGSITKTFTGVLLAYLCQAGRMSVDDSIANYFSELSPLKQITLRHLVTHTSGLPSAPDNLIDSEILQEDPWGNYSSFKLFQWLKSIGHEQLLFTPGSKVDYSNSGMCLLGCILSKVAGKSYEALISEVILKPLDMRSTFFSSMPKSEMARFAVPHFGEHEVSAWNFQDCISAIGGLRSTTRDLIKYIKAHLGFTHVGTTIGKALALSHKTLFPAKFPADNSMCYGIFTVMVSTSDDSLQRTWYLHTGGTGGSASCLILDLERQTGAIMLSNADYENNHRLLNGVLFPEILPDILVSIKPPSVIPRPNPSLTSSLCGGYITDDCFVSIVFKDEKLTVTYHAQDPIRYGKPKPETFYPCSDYTFFSKSSADILEFRKELDRFVLKIGDKEFERFELPSTLFNDFWSYRDHISACLEPLDIPLKFSTYIAEYLFDPEVSKTKEPGQTPISSLSSEAYGPILMLPLYERLRTLPALKHFPVKVTQLIAEYAGYKAVP